jgi:hypothetical protein
MPTCAGGADVGFTGDPETASYVNLSGAAVPVYIVVDSYYMTPPVTFDLTTALAAVMPGEACGNAIPLAAPGTAMDMNAAYNDYHPLSACTGFGTPGLERVYSTTIPAGATLTANLMPGGTEDISLYFLAADQCVASPTCLAGTDVGASGGAETLMYMNAGTTPLDVFVVVDSWVSDPFTYTLTLSTM